jgi:hypothetical protein
MAVRELFDETLNFFNSLRGMLWIGLAIFSLILLSYTDFLGFLAFYRELLFWFLILYIWFSIQFAAISGLFLLVRKLYSWIKQAKFSLTNLHVKLERLIIGD